MMPRARDEDTGEAFSRDEQLTTSKQGVSDDFGLHTRYDQILHTMTCEAVKTSGSTDTVHKFILPSNSDLRSFSAANISGS